ncbi:prolyl oligopeptidase family serine peptidase [Brevundimonas sp. FT23042]|uniref:S9 family peptidase n=1 Tax=Brevundimonas sp. FT23042 TaxID=3393749 RepID=UPI003B5872E7
MAEPLTLETLLGLETWGRIAIDPSGSVAVVEERRAKADLPRYDLQPDGALRYARLLRLDLGSLSALRPLLPMEADAGYTSGPFSPDGRRLAVIRLQGVTLRLGVVDLVEETVVWTDISPVTPDWGRAMEWVSNDTLVVIGMADGGLPPRLAEKITAQTRLPHLWSQAAAGQEAYVSTGWSVPSPTEPQRRLFRVAAGTGVATALADGAFLDFEASPDGRYAALIEDGDIQRLTADAAGGPDRRPRAMTLVDLATGATVSPADTRDIATSLLSWSPDSQALLLAALDGPSPRLLSVSVTGETARLSPEGLEPLAPVDVFGLLGVQAGWMGNIPLVRAAGPEGEGWYRLPLSGPRRLEGLSADARLQIQGSDGAVFVSDGALVRLDPDFVTSNLGPAAAIARPDEPLGHRRATDAMKATESAIRGPDGRLCRVGLTASPPAPCVDGAARAAVSWRFGASLQAGTQGRSRNLLTLQRGGGETVLMQLNPELDTVALAEPRLVTGPHGARGWLYLPRSSEAAPPPIIVIPYPGKTYPAPPREMEPESQALTVNGQLLVAAGYAVLFPDLPEVADPSDDLANRILAVVDAAGNDGLADPDRLGLWGWSFGAWATATSIAQSDRFDAAVAINGAYDLTTVIGGVALSDRIVGRHDFAVASSARWLERGQAAMLKPYWQDPARYERNSPFRQADRIRTPLLLFESELDHSTTQAERLYGALTRLDRPVALTVLFGEDHSIHNPGNGRLYYSQVLEWFDQYLRPAGTTVPSTDAARLPPAPD